MEISRFECPSKNLSLSIFNIEEHNLENKLKVILTSGDNQTKHPIIATIKSVNKSVFKDENIESKMQKINLCPGLSEAKLMPLLSQFGNVNSACILFFIEMVQGEIIYRSRKCEMVTHGDLCDSCTDLMQDLKLDLSAGNGTETDLEENQAIVVCEPVKEVYLMDGDDDENCDNYSNYLVDKKLEPIEEMFDENKSECMQLERIKQESNLKIEVEELNMVEELCNIIKIEAEPEPEPQWMASVIKKGPRIRKRIPLVVKVCPICAKEVKDLSNHIKDMHTETPGYHICNQCGKVFNKIKRLKGHIDTAHKEQPVVCDICSKVFKHLHSLRCHKRKVHIPIEIIEAKCPSCPKIFDTNAKLYYHKRSVHTLEDSKCHLCGKTYKNKSLLHKHQKVYHKDWYEAQKK
eukprot:GFUD01022108.1.p1 GENE.GFUD01022108.1~~GFUD01022108.1.p1  ORF type:complete len:405 (+),score=105.01 GFUD01022108.1:60-1274(+)